MTQQHDPNDRDRPSLVHVCPTPTRGDFLILDQRAVRIRVSFNVEQSLDHVDVEEGAGDVTVTAWVGWRPDARHLQNPSAVTAGKATLTRDVKLSRGLGSRRLVEAPGRGKRSTLDAAPRAQECSSSTCGPPNSCE